MSTTNYHIAIVGPTDTVSGFKALGVETYPASTGAEALSQLRAIKKMTDDQTNNINYAVVCVIEDLLVEVDPVEYSKVVQGALPAVVTLPGPAGSQGVALERLRSLAEKAIGSAII
jgi:V/A-type H+-transporting ATPase subunit F